MTDDIGKESMSSYYLENAYNGIHNLDTAGSYIVEDDHLVNKPG